MRSKEPCCGKIPPQPRQEHRGDTSRPAPAGEIVASGRASERSVRNTRAATTSSASAPVTRSVPARRARRPWRPPWWLIIPAFARCRAKSRAQRSARARVAVRRVAAWSAASIRSPAPAIPADRAVEVAPHDRPLPGSRPRRRRSRARSRRAGARRAARCRSARRAPPTRRARRGSDGDGRLRAELPHPSRRGGSRQRTRARLIQQPVSARSCKQREAGRSVERERDPGSDERDATRKRFIARARRGTIGPL